ncbi:MAG: hypothetical protein CVV27_14695 [Candidatus Melainabacteria bacterium HGW-Melainabacteria-1]|nr:MAG: hypothetical protein CVV27_14695 [Candidatus Melainabacteria bacterium HGW-Melainabacteria-1]
MKAFSPWSGELPGDLEQALTLQAQLEHSLIAPAEKLFARPHKQLRAELVRIGFLLSGEHHEKGSMTATEAEAIAVLGDVLEVVHAGSLVVDDIQDQSPLRRGQPSLHCLLGVPLAINLGNWLYFKPLEWIQALGLPPARELALYRVYHQTLTRAHMGQALDLGTRMLELEQAEVKGLCQSAMHLKTGVLMSLALQMGALIGDAGAERLKLLANWGEHFGVALQICNDLQSLKPGPERFHDLSLQRPGFVWSLVAEHASPEAYRAWNAAVADLPESGPLEAWIQRHDLLSLACRVSAEKLAATRAQLISNLSDENNSIPFHGFDESLSRIEQLIKRICHAYI